jgi:hypothetical protein
MCLPERCGGRSGLLPDVEGGEMANAGTASGGRKSSATRGAGRRRAQSRRAALQSRAQAAACSRGEDRGGRERGRRKGLKCKIRETQGLHCKTLITFKSVLKWRWSKKQKCIVFQTLQLFFKVHLQLSNNFEDTINLVIFSNFM